MLTRKNVCMHMNDVSRVCRIHFQWLTPVLLLFLRAMLFHNCDLIGKALSEFTGTDLPFKKSDFGQEPGMKMLSWEVSMPVLLISSCVCILIFVTLLTLYIYCCAT